MRDEARLDISARVFGTKYQIAFFDVRVFDSARGKKTKIYSNVTGQKKWKKRKYNERIMQVENGSFIHYIFLINVGMGKANRCYSPKVTKLAEKRGATYSVIMSWNRSKVSFSIMKSIIICIRGSRSIRHEREKHKFEE